jgi:hypothetical protein
LSVLRHLKLSRLVTRGSLFEGMKVVPFSHKRPRKEGVIWSHPAGPAAAQEGGNHR